MANAKAKLYYTSSSYLDSLPIKNGNIIFVPDSHTVCLDMSSQRYSFQTIAELATEEERTSLGNPIEGYYFVAEDNSLWRYKDNWRRITPANLSPTVYGVTKEDFPAEGELNSLYFTDEGIFN